MPRPPALLLVEPDDGWRTQVRRAASPLLIVDTYIDYGSARRQLVLGSYAFIVTNIRLEAYNGIQLVYLARDRHPGCRALAYTETREVGLARDAQFAGAFYDTCDRLHLTLPAWLTARLPPADRRDPAEPSRRSSSRDGGRRAWDHRLAGASQVGPARSD